MDSCEETKISRSFTNNIGKHSSFDVLLERQARLRLDRQVTELQQQSVGVLAEVLFVLLIKEWITKLFGRN